MRGKFAESVTHQPGLTVKTLLSMGCRLPRNMWTMRPCSCFCIESPTTSSRVLVLCRCCSTCNSSCAASNGIGGTPDSMFQDTMSSIGIVPGAVTSIAVYWW